MTYGDWNNDGNLSQTEAWGTMIQTGYLDDCDGGGAKTGAHYTIRREPPAGSSAWSRMSRYWKVMSVLIGIIVVCSLIMLGMDLGVFSQISYLVCWLFGA